VVIAISANFIPWPALWVMPIVAVCGLCGGVAGVILSRTRGPTEHDPRHALVSWLFVLGGVAGLLMWLLSVTNSWSRLLGTG
jgi:hypothetical protein